MKKLFYRVFLCCVAFAMLFVFAACEPQSEKPGEKPSDEPEEIVLKASTLKLPEESAFSLSFSEQNAQFGNIKTALPTCGNAYLNDLISTTVCERVTVFTPEEGASAVALDLEDVKKAENLYSFLFAVHYQLADKSSSVVRFYLSADVGGGSLLKLSDVVKIDYFDSGAAGEYVQSYLKEHYNGQFDESAVLNLIVAAESVDGFFVQEKGVVLVLGPEEVGAEKALTVYLSDAALTLYKRNGKTSPSEPESTLPQNYEPAKEGEKVVAMTFDDGPGSTSTTKLLDYLEANSFKATFFVNGLNYCNLETDEYAKAALRRAVDLNCEIGNHSYAHPYFQKLTPEQRSYQLDHNAELIEAACGVYPNLFRAPGGTFPKGMPEADEYFYIYWNADGEDWKYKNEGDPQALAERYLQYIGSGSIVLFHDIYPNSVDAAIIVMNTLKAQGYRFVTVSELLNLQDKVPDGTIYTSQYGTRDYMSVELNG